ncbi:Uncharacterised protein [Mycobacteroides abscessus subsp. abscessus]|nr:Uncharacterised protein [Mycobacteroides abscessus subsp. abscessus]
MDHVGTRVALGGAVTPVWIHRGHHLVTLDELAGFHRNLVHEQCFGDLLDVRNLRLRGRVRTVSANGTDIGDLTARFGVQRSAVQHDLGFGSRRRHGHPGAIHEDTQNSCCRI